MKISVRRILIGVFIVVLTVTLMGASLTMGMYSDEPKPSQGSYDNNIQFIVAEQVEVYSVDDFFAAIDSGYANIKIADGVENPFVVSGGMTPVTADLIIDLNGHDIQRNNREPMLNIGEGVKVVIIDTSEGATGSFYNPVGSVLAVGGGSLTVLSGEFESGPRTLEYYSADSTSGTGSSTIGGSISETIVTSLYKKDTTSPSGYDAGESAVLPLLVPNPIRLGQGITLTADDGKSYSYYINGNVYFDGAPAITGVTSVNITEDTFLNFTDDSTSTSTIASSQGSADFYYDYTLYRGFTGKYVADSTSTGTYPELKYSLSGDGLIDPTQVQVRIYGYNNVIGSAQVQDDNPNYATIKMSSGSLAVSGGIYRSYFGVYETNCIYTSGGRMEVADGSFSAIKESGGVVCAFTKDKDGNISGTLSIADGEFSVERGNAIRVTGGEMSIYGGTFAKNATDFSSDLSLPDVGSDDEPDNRAAIEISGGKLTIEGKDSEAVVFNMYGSFIQGIKSSSGSEVNVSYTEFNFAEKADDSSGKSVDFIRNAGIYASGGEINVAYTAFNMASKQASGIYTSGSGSDTATNSSTDAVNIRISRFVMTGEAAIGVYAMSGTVNLGKNYTSVGDGDYEDYTMFYIDHILNCYGVYAPAPAVGQTAQGLTININRTQFLMGQKENNASELSAAEDNVNAAIKAYTGTEKRDFGAVNGAGIYSANENAYVNLGDGLFILSGSGTSGVYAEKGHIGTVDNTNVHKSVVISGALYENYELGVSKFPSSKNDYGVQSKLSVAPANGVDGTERYSAIYGHGIFTSGGNITLSNVFAAVYGEYSTGVCAYDGEIVVNGSLDVAVRVDVSASAAEPSYLSSTAISTDGQSSKGHITLKGITVIETNSLGVTIRNGDFTVTTSTTAGSAYGVKIDSTRGTAIYLNGGNLNLGAATVYVACTIDLTCGWGDAEKTVAHSYDGIFVEGSGSAFNSNGLLNMQFQGVENVMQGTVTTYQPLENNIKSYAVNVVSKTGSDATVLSSVTIEQANITSSVGGGVKVESGTITLGKAGVADSNKNDLIKINTTGTAYYSSLCGGSASGNWQYYVSKTGGHCVRVMDGSITIYYGTYTAYLGNGILVSGGEATVYDGAFTGYNQSYQGDNKNGSGLGGYCGLVLYSGGTFTSYGGTYRGANGGAFVSGKSATVKATAHIHSGSFEKSYFAYDKTDYQTTSNGFSVGTYADVTFGNEDGSTANSDITIKAEACAIALENNAAIYGGYGVGSFGDQVSVTVYAGIYEATRSSNANVIWAGNTNAKMTFGACSLSSSSTCISGGSPTLLSGYVITYGTTTTTDVNVLRNNSGTFVITKSS